MLGLVAALLVFVSSMKAGALDVPPAYRQVAGNGVREFEAGHWSAARALFQRAHDLFPNARTWRSLALCDFELGRYLDARTEMLSALADPSQRLTSELAAEAKKFLEMAQARIAHVTFVLPDHATELIVDHRTVLVLVDGAMRSAAPLSLDPGQHVFEARLDEQSSLLRSVILHPGETRVVSLLSSDPSYYFGGRSLPDGRSLPEHFWINDGQRSLVERSRMASPQSAISRWLVFGTGAAAAGFVATSIVSTGSTRTVGIIGAVGLGAATAGLIIVPLLLPDAPNAGATHSGLGLRGFYIRGRF